MALRRASSSAPQRGHRRTVVRTVVVTQVVLAILTAVGVYVAYGNLAGNIPEGEEIPHAIAPPSSDGPERPLNILVMGDDSRSGDGNDIDGEGGGGGSDVTILLHVSADRSSAYGVSLPRDAMVARPECGEGEDAVPAADPVIFNEAFALGGPQCTVKMVESLTGVFIDHFVVLDFAGFKAMVDAVNGVEVCIPEDVDSKGIRLEAGTQVLDGDQALDYVRERTELAITGDIGRMKRQQAFIASMVSEVFRADTLSRPDRVYRFLDAVTGSLRVDSELDSLKALFDLSMEFRQTGLGEISFITVPLREYAPNPDRLEWTEDADALWRRIRQDRPLGSALQQGSVRADEPVGTPDGTPDTQESPSDGASAGGDRPAPDRSEAEAEARRQAGLCA